MEIEVLRIGQRVVRDDRVTTHVALVARSFGAQKVYMNEVNPEIEDTISSINKTWGGNFKIEIISEWKKIIMEKKNAAIKIASLLAEEAVVAIFQGAAEFKTSTTKDSSPQRVRVFAKRRTKNPM